MALVLKEEDMATSNNDECSFCMALKAKPNGFTDTMPKSKEDGYIPCSRGIWQDDFCLATLDYLPITHGDTLLVLKQHREDFCDESLTKKELEHFAYAIKLVAGRLRSKLTDCNGDPPERIYVCSLCDGVQHLHAHLTPRYRWTKEDAALYRRLIAPRDGIAKAEQNADEGKIGGFWYLGYKEVHRGAHEPWDESDDEKAARLAKLAARLRF